MILFCVSKDNNIIRSTLLTLLDIVPHKCITPVKNFIGYNGVIYTFFFLFRYTEARKDREKFRKRLTEVIMHRDEWDDEEAEPGTN